MDNMWAFVSLVLAVVFFFGGYTKSLCCEQSVDGSGYKPFEVVVARLCFALLAPFAETA